MDPLECSSTHTTTLLLLHCRHFTVLKKTYFCDVSWEEEAHSLYSLISSSFHFALTFVVAAFLYSLIYYRLRSR